MRVFFSIGLSSEAQKAVQLAQNQYKEMFRRSKVSWTPLSNMHLTLLFLGEVDEDVVPELRSRLREGKYPDPFQLTLKGAGCFPHKKRPKILTVETTLHPFISSLRKQVADAAIELGLEFDTKPFLPHITVGRVRVASETCSSENIAVQPVKFEVTSFELMASELTNDGSEYTIIESFSL